MKAFPQSVIKKHYNNRPNVITPLPLDYGYINNSIVYELSTGKGIFGTPLYGVTVVKLVGCSTDAMFDDNKCLHSLVEAEQYIEVLRDKYNTKTIKG